MFGPMPILVSTVSPLSFHYFTTGSLQSSVLRIYGSHLDSRSFSLVFHLRYSSVFSASSSSPAQPGFLSASPFIPISALLSSLSISGVLAAQPASSFLASVYSTIVLLSAFLPPRLISDFLCPSQLLPFLNLYSLPMARLLLSVSCSVRRFRRFLEPPSSIVNLLIDVSSFSAVYPFRSPLSLPSCHLLLFYGLCYCRSCCLMDMDWDRSGARS